MCIRDSYCTDELSARKFLTPKMLEWFDRQISQNAMCVFLKDKKLFISLYTDRYIFPTPQKPEDIDQLSLVTEYHKLCRELALIKEITAIFEDVYKRQWSSCPFQSLISVLDLS